MKLEFFGVWRSGHHSWHQRGAEGVSLERHPGFPQGISDGVHRRRQNPWTITSCRAQKNMTLLKLKGIETIEEAVKLRGKTLYIRRADAKLEEGDYFIQELIGLSVVDRDTGRVYGTLTDVSQTRG
mgnify:CR=1 FL=1